jgi:hypothetical protein
MPLPKPPIAALTALFLLTSCASSRPPVTEPPKPLPAELATRCPGPPPAPITPEVDAVALALKDMYDAYGLCAGRLVDLLDYIQGGGKP